MSETTPHIKDCDCESTSTDCILYSEADILQLGIYKSDKLTAIIHKLWLEILELKRRILNIPPPVVVVPPAVDIHFNYAGVPFGGIPSTGELATTNGTLVGTSIARYAVYPVTGLAYIRLIQTSLLFADDWILPAGVTLITATTNPDSFVWDVDISFNVTANATYNFTSPAIPSVPPVTIGFRMGGQLFTTLNEIATPLSTYISQGGDSSIVYTAGTPTSTVDFKLRKLGFATPGDETPEALALEYQIPVGITVNLIEIVDGGVNWLLHCTVVTSANVTYQFHKAKTITIGGSGRNNIMAGANIRVIRQGDLATIATFSPVALSSDSAYPGWGTGAFLENIGSFKAWTDKGYRIDVKYNLFTQPGKWGFYGVSEDQFCMIGNLPGLAGDAGYPVVAGMIRGGFDIAMAIPSDPDTSLPVFCT